jgi:hypothetical protein
MIREDISLFIYFIDNLFGYIEVVNDFTIPVALSKHMRLGVLDELDGITAFIINIITDGSNDRLDDVNNIVGLAKHTSLSMTATDWQNCRLM